MENDKNFCVRCGAILPEGAKFCGECGLSFDQQQTYVPPSYSGTPSGNRTKKLGAVPACIILYGVLAVILSLSTIYVMVDFDNIMNMLYDMAEQIGGSEAQQLIDMLNSIKEIMTPDVRNLNLIMGIVFFVSAICAITSGILANRQRYWKTALWLCAIATATSVSTGGVISIVVCVAVGAYMTYRIYQAKDLFEC